MNHFFKDVKEVVAHALKHGHIAATETQIHERAAICEACPERKEEKCGICGCIIKYKIAFAAGTCPSKPPRWS